MVFLNFIEFVQTSIGFEVKPNNQCTYMTTEYPQNVVSGGFPVCANFSYQNTAPFQMEYTNYVDCSQNLQYYFPPIRYKIIPNDGNDFLTISQPSYTTIAPQNQVYQPRLPNLSYIPTISENQPAFFIKTSDQIYDPQFYMQKKSENC